MATPFDVVGFQMDVINQNLRSMNNGIIYQTNEAEEGEIECHHVCSGSCRREGCNCEHGEWHEEPVDSEIKAIKEENL